MELPLRASTSPSWTSPKLRSSGELSSSTRTPLTSGLAALPPITVPTITLEGANNGAPHPAPASYRAKFTGKYEHRDLPGAVGHNPPQEDPTAFVQAVVDADRL